MFTMFSWKHEKWIDFEVSTFSDNGECLDWLYLSCILDYQLLFHLGDMSLSLGTEDYVPITHEGVGGP